jgi:ABC-type multidrug transport system fused ATPase/permease subunit
MFLDGLTSCRRLSVVFALPAEDAGATSAATPKGNSARTERATTHGLSVRGLGLSIDGKRLLSGIDLQIAPGELVAVVGEVGAGKSLLIDALLREVPAEFEAYEIDGEDALAMDFADIRKHYALVPQDGFVMSASLRDNVALEYGAPAGSDSDVVRSLTLSAFDPSTESLTAGLDTELGERGVNLSGGQRQRIGLGRAHFSDRAIVLLDGCLSAVDVDTERRLVDDLIDGAWRGRTRILVTHRLSVLPRADRVILMGKGKVVASGRYEELMATSDRFRKVAHAMAGKPVEEASI